jgi:hypothetical protein
VKGSGKGTSSGGGAGSIALAEMRSRLAKRDRQQYLDKSFLDFSRES